LHSRSMSARSAKRADVRAIVDVRQQFMSRWHLLFGVGNL
jgi:hypothetical protein